MIFADCIFTVNKPNEIKRSVNKLWVVTGFKIITLFLKWKNNKIFILSGSRTLLAVEYRYHSRQGSIFLFILFKS